MTVARRRMIFVVVDGMRDDTALRYMGFMEGLVERGLALRCRVKSILPSLSRPCYEAILTGTSPDDNGIVGNDVVRLSRFKSVFHVLSAAGKQSAAVAFYWVSELYSRAPFDFVQDCEQDGNADTFTYGRFYYQDAFPDAHVMSLAEMLRTRYDPAFLLIHPMNTDDAGHRFGSDSKAYRNAVAAIDELLSMRVPQWLAEGYTVIVTADHGMDPDGSHGGTDPGVRIVPFYLSGPGLVRFGRQADILDQTTLASLICRVLGVEPAPTMRLFPDELYGSWFHHAVGENG